MTAKLRQLITALLCSALLLSANYIYAQTNVGNITTGGPDCTVPTNCVQTNLTIIAGTILITVTGNWSGGPLQFEFLGYGADNWHPLNATNLVSFANVNATQLNGDFGTASITYNAVRVRSAGPMTGAATVRVHAVATTAVAGVIFGGGVVIPSLISGITATPITVVNAPHIWDNYSCFNNNSTVAFVQVFDALPTNVILGTTVPKWAISIAPNDRAGLTGLNLDFLNAISIAATTTSRGSTALAVPVDCNFGYK